jgi:hypothetical protein
MRLASSRVRERAGLAGVVNQFSVRMKNSAASLAPKGTPAVWGVLMETVVIVLPGCDRL